MDGDAVPDDEPSQQYRRDEEIHQGSERGSDRHDDSWKVHPGNQLLISDQAVCRFRDCAREQLPWKQRSQREERIRNAVRRNSSKTAEENAEDNHHRERLKNGPDDSQCSLLIADLDVAPRQKVNELPVRPQLTRIQQPPHGSAGSQIPECFRYDSIVSFSPFSNGIRALKPKNSWALFVSSDRRGWPSGLVGSQMNFPRKPVISPISSARSRI